MAATLPALILATLLWAPKAQADIPASLKSSCAARTPHPGFSYKFCNDGLPPTATGGLSPNESGTNAVEVPAKYAVTSGNDNYTGLPPRAEDAATMAGADSEGNVALDVDISIPTVSAPPGGYPLLVFMHGCCGGAPPYIVGADKTDWEATSFDGSRGEQWHYNNAWFASRGYVVINYTARGFVTGTNTGSTGETQLDSRRFEINDFQHLAGLVTDDPFFNVDPQKVVTTGGSYGGGFSWLTMTDPIWASPGGKEMKLAAVAPKYGWTDLVDSLVPTGRHSQTRGDLPAFDGSDTLTPTGIVKESLGATLYENGRGGFPPNAPNNQHTTFPPYIDEFFACFTSPDPYESNPLCANTRSTILPSFVEDRSAYYQDDWFAKIANDPSYRIPIFSAGTFSDPLFPAAEHLRMANRIQSVVPDYPIQQYYGDYMHFVQNKAKEWGDICVGSFRHVCGFSDYPNGDVNAAPNGLVRTGVTTRLNRLIDHYAQPPGNPDQPQPSFDVTASLQICPSNASLEGVPADEPGETFTASDFESLAGRELTIDMPGTQTTLNDVEPNPHAANSDPVARFVENFGTGTCVTETTPAGPGVAVYQSDPLGSTQTMIGATKVTIHYTATTTEGNFQLNSRLYDVFPDGQAVMVDRGVRRVTEPSGAVTYELRGNGWRFRAGHSIRIEIAQDDGPHLKSSNVTSSATLSHVRLQIPVRPTGYARPRAATPNVVRLVPAFEQCASPNASHGAPLAVASCNPPVQASDYLTVGTPESNGNTARFTGSLELKVVGESPIDPDNGDQADIQIRASLMDVRRRDNLSDYTGELRAVLGLRITDNYNGPGLGDPSTVTDAPFSFDIPCAATSGPEGGACNLSTTADAIMSEVALEGQRAIWELQQVKVFDGGADGDAETGDNTLFAVQGAFAP